MRYTDYLWRNTKRGPKDLGLSPASATSWQVTLESSPNFSEHCLLSPFERGRTLEVTL